MSKKAGSGKVEYTCKFCKKSYSRETTLQAHMCVQKRRFNDADTAGSRIGFQAYKRFHEKNFFGKKEKTFEEYITSQYYLDFARLGNYIVNLKPISQALFIDYIFDSNVKSSEWTKDILYECFVADLVKREPADAGAIRSIETIIEWCSKHDCEVTNFFATVPIYEASHMIKFGKISPWVLYLSTTGDDLISRFNEDVVSSINSILYPPFWRARIRKFEDDAAFVSTLLEDAGI